MLNIFSKVCFILALICSSNFSHASVSKQMFLVGEIISFDQTHVRVKSGNQEYIFSKADLDHPSYVIGNRIELSFNLNKLNQAKVKGIKSGKNSKSLSI